MPFLTRQVTIESASAHCGGRIDRLIQELAGGARSHIAGMFDHGCVSLNGELTREAWWRLKSGDHVRVRYEDRRRYVPHPRPQSHQGFAIVFEDRDCLVVDKSPDLLTVPTRRSEPNTLVDLLGQYLRRCHRGSEVSVVHRLDRGVSGLLVFGKSVPIAAALRDQFAARKPERRYVAIVAGRIQQQSGEFRSYLATDRELNRYSTDDEEVGQLAITHYRVLEQSIDTTLVEVRLETGRRNQIRVHFAEFGHPVIGDPRYGGKQATHPDWPCRRIALHAKTLAFTHPITRQFTRFDSHYPVEMVRFMTGIEGKSRRD